MRVFDILEHGIAGLPGVLRVSGDAILPMSLFALCAVWVIRRPVGRCFRRVQNVHFARWVTVAAVEVLGLHRVFVMIPVTGVLADAVDIQWVKNDKHGCLACLQGWSPVESQRIDVGL
jgi:hypothetical protein